MKTCPTCKKEKELTPNGYCRECVTEYNRNYMKNKGRKSFQDWRSTSTGKQKTKKINRKAYLKRIANKDTVNDNNIQLKPVLDTKPKPKSKPKLKEKIKPNISNNLERVTKKQTNLMHTVGSITKKEKMSMKDIGNKNDTISNLLDYFVLQQEKVNKVDKSCYDSNWRHENFDTAKSLLEKKDNKYWEKIIDALLEDKWWGKNRSRTMRDVNAFEQEYYKNAVSNKKVSAEEKIKERISFVSKLKQDISVRKKHKSVRLLNLKPNSEYDKYFEADGKTLKMDIAKEYKLIGIR